MFSTEDDDFSAVCRDELCRLDYVHPSHIFPLGEATRPKRPWWLKTEPNAYRRPDPKGLRQIIKQLFASTDWPLAFVDVRSVVVNDYGSASNRTIHRHLERLVDGGFVRALDLKLEFSYLAYIRHDSKYLADMDNLREHMAGKYTPPIRRRRSLEQIAALTERAI